MAKDMKETVKIEEKKLSKEEIKEKKKLRKIYIAYGSNMDICRMMKRTKTSLYYGVGYIEGYRLTFQKSNTGYYANVIESKNLKDYVPVVFYQISELDEELLDYYEGYPLCYKKKMITAHTSDGKKLEGLIYTLPRKRQFGVPDGKYINLITNAYIALGFDYELEILREAVNYSFKRAKMKIFKENREKYKIEKTIIITGDNKKDNKSLSKEIKKVLPLASRNVKLDNDAENFYNEMAKLVSNKFKDKLTSFIESKTNALLIADKNTGEPFFVIYPVDCDGDFYYEFLKDGSRGSYKDVDIDSFMDYIENSLKESDDED